MMCSAARPPNGQWAIWETPELELSGNNTPEVRSLVQVPGKAKAESDERPKQQALGVRLKEKCGDTFFS